MGEGPEVGGSLEKLAEFSWAGEKRARWLFLLNLKSDSQTQTERVQRP